MKFEVTEETWIISDTHFGHNNIVRYCDRPSEHNKLMLDSWRSLVKEDDVVLHLGDVTIWYDTYKAWATTVSSLPGKKYLIPGNHDEQWNKRQWKSKVGMTVIKPFRQNQIYFSHEPITETKSIWSVNVHGHTHNHSPFKCYWRAGLVYYNASVEGMGYKPVRMRTILQEIHAFV